jgi:hypothetical protein
LRIALGRAVVVDEGFGHERQPAGELAEADELIGLGPVVAAPVGDSVAVEVRLEAA